MCNDVIALLSLVFLLCSRNLKPLQQQNQHFHELFCPCGNKKTAAVPVFEKATADLVYRHCSRVAYAADCGSRGFCMIIFGQYTKIIGESIRKQKHHVAYFYDGFPVFWAIF